MPQNKAPENQPGEDSGTLASDDNAANESSTAKGFPVGKISSLETASASTHATATHATASESEAPRLDVVSRFASPWFWLMILVALGIFAPFVPVPNMTSAIAGAIALTIVYVVATVLFAAHATRLQLSVRDTTLFFGVAIALWSVLQFAIAPAVFTLFQALRLEGDEPSASQLILLHVTTTLTDVSLLSAAVVGGSLVGRLIRSPNMLGPICAIIALIDVWGVLFGGIVSQLLDKTPQLAATAMATIPSVGSAVASAPGTPSYSIPLPDIGAGDYLFLGLLFFPLHFNRMNWRGAAKLTTPLIALALISIPLSRILLHQNIALPGLLPIGLGVALPNWKYFQFTREEKFALLYAAIFVIILTIALYFGITSQLPDQPPTP